MGCSGPSLFKFLAFVVCANILFIVYLVHVLNYDEWTDNVVDPEPEVKPHHLCIITPYRDRMEELTEFSPHLHTFLNNQVGWMEADRIACDYMAMHDVDLLPQNPEIDYRFPGEGVVRHISSPKYHPKYNYSNFIGGILMFTMKDYKSINGMSNKYWGWGLEDDELFLRIKEQTNLQLTRVDGLKTDRKTTFRHIHGPERKRDYAVVTKDQRAFKRKRDRVSGLANVRYRIASRRILTFGTTSVRIVDVELHCDMTWTPYCILPK